MQIWEKHELVKDCIAFRHVPDAAPADGGFEKKTEFAQKFLFESQSLHFLFSSDVPLVKALANYVWQCHAELDNRAEVISRQATEIAQLNAAREWVPIKSAGQFSGLSCGTYELCSWAGLVVAQKTSTGFYVDGERREIDWILKSYPYYRLITRAEDFTPPDPLYTIGDAQYTGAELAKVLAEQGYPGGEGESK